MPDEFPTLAGVRTHFDEMVAVARTDRSLSGAAFAFAFTEAVNKINGLLARTAGQALTEFVAIYRDHLGPDRCHELTLMAVELDDAARAADATGADDDAPLTFPEPLDGAGLADRFGRVMSDGSTHVTAVYRGYRFAAYRRPAPGTTEVYRVVWMRVRDTRTSETVYVFDGRTEVIPPSSENAKRVAQWLFRGLGDPVVPVPSYSPQEDYPWLTPSKS